MVLVSAPPIRIPGQRLWRVHGPNVARTTNLHLLRYHLTDVGGGMIFAQLGPPPSASSSRKRGAPPSAEVLLRLTKSRLCAQKGDKHSIHLITDCK